MIFFEFSLLTFSSFLLACSAGVFWVAAIFDFMKEEDWGE